MWQFLQRPKESLNRDCAVLYCLSTYKDRFFLETMVTIWVESYHLQLIFIEMKENNFVICKLRIENFEFWFGELVNRELFLTKLFEITFHESWIDQCKRLSFKWSAKNQYKRNTNVFSHLCFLHNPFHCFLPWLPEHDVHNIHHLFCFPLSKKFFTAAVNKLDWILMFQWMCSKSLYISSVVSYI